MRINSLNHDCLTFYSCRAKAEKLRILDQLLDSKAKSLTEGEEALRQKLAKFKQKAADIVGDMEI